MVNRSPHPTAAKRRARAMVVVVPTLALMLSACGQEPGVVPGEMDHCVLICAVVRSITGEPERVSEASAVAPVAKPKRSVPTRLASLHTAAEPPRRVVNQEPPLRRALAATPVAAPPPIDESIQPMTPQTGAPALEPIPGSVAIDPVTSRFVLRAPAF